MIVVDTSALMAIALKEPGADRCMAALAEEDRVLMSAGTVAESLIVAARRNIMGALIELLDQLGVEVVSVTPASARRIGQVYERWGKGIHPAGLNFGDCFAYELAKQSHCPLLYVGNDFARTDIAGVM